MAYGSTFRALRAAAIVLGVIAAAPSAFAQTPPAQPAVTAGTATTTTIPVSWTIASWGTDNSSANYNDTDVTVTVCATPGNICAAGPLTGADTTATISGLTPGTPYTITVTAENPDGGPAAPGTATATTVSAAAIPTAAPTGVQANAASSQSIAVQWTAIAAGAWGTGPTGVALTAADGTYEACATPTSGGTPVCASTTDGTELDVTIPGLSPANSYDIEVYATNATGRSATAGSAAGPVVTPAAAIGGGISDVPTMSEWALIVMALLIAASAVMFGRRRQQ